ncbi:MAG TPA: hypothetical protein VGM30_10505 [Puia sp.]
MPDFHSLYNPDLSSAPVQIAPPDLHPVQDPFQGYNPDNGINHVDAALSTLDKNLFKPTTDRILQPVGYDADALNADRYRKSDYFGQLGFNPFSNNEERYGDRQSNFNKLGSAFGGAWQLIKNQFVEQAGSWGDTLNFFKDNKSAFEESDFDEINKHQRELFTDHAIFETAAQRDSIWNFNTIANTIQQSGYAVGAISEIAAEELALSLLTAATFGGTSELQVARSAKLAASVGGVLRKTEQLGEALNTASRLRKVFETVNKVNPLLDNTLEFAANLKNISRAENIAAGGSKLGNLRTAARGFGAFYRDVREFNAAVAEAKSEAASSYQDLKSVLTTQYKKDHDGNDPVGTDAQKIQDTAMGAAQTNGVSNTYLIMLSNKIGMGNIMGGFKGLKDLEESAESGILRFSEKQAAKTGVKLADAASNKWLAFKQNLLRTPFSYLKTNLDEALQENLQDVSHDAIQNYYQAKYNDNKGEPVKSIADYITAAAANQFHVQGAKTFISGFLTGAIIGPGEYAIEKSGNIKQYLTDKTGYQQRQAEVKQSRNEIIDAGNKIWKNPLNFDYKTGDVTLQANFNTILKQAAQTNNKEAFYDIKDDALRHFILTGIRSGALDSFNNRLKSYTKNLSPEEFTTAFGIEYNEKNQGAVVNQVNAFGERASEIKELHENISADLKNPFNPFRFTPGERIIGNPQYVKEALSYKAWNDAVDNYVFTKSYYQDTIRGQANILSSFRNKAGFKDANFNDIYLLTSKEHLNAEIDNLQKEVKNLQPDKGDAGARTLNTQKRDRLAVLEKYKGHLEKWSESFDKHSTLPVGDQRTNAFNESFDAFKQQTAPLFGEFINNELKATDKAQISKDNVLKGFDSLHNYMKLQKQSGIILDKVNLLADPGNFSKFFAEHDKAIKGAYDFSTAVQEATGPADTATVHFKDEKGNDQSHTFTVGETYVGKMSQLEKYRGKGKTATQFNNDKIKIAAISADGKTISIALNGEPAVDMDAEEVAKLARDHNWKEYSKLSPIQQTYLSLRNKIITYRLLQRDSKGLPVKDAKGQYVPQDVKGRVKLNEKKDGLLFAYGNNTIEFNPKYVVNQQDLSELPTVQQQALKEQQDRIQRNFKAQVSIFEEAFKDTESKLEEQKALTRANQEEFTKTTEDLGDLKAHLDLVIGELEKNPYKGIGRRSNENKALTELKELLSKQIGEKNLYLQRLTQEQEVLQQSYETLKKANDLYAQAFFELQENETPFDKGNQQNIYDSTQGDLTEAAGEQVNKRLSDEQIDALIEDTRAEVELIQERIVVVHDLVTTAEKALRKIEKFDDIIKAVSEITDKRQLITYLSTLKGQSDDPEKRSILSALIKGLNKGDLGFEAQFILEKAAILKDSRKELADLLENAAQVQDKYDRLTLAREQRAKINILQQRVNYLKQVQDAISTGYGKIVAKQSLTRQAHLTKAKTAGIAQELHDFGDIMSTSPVIVSTESPFFDDIHKPRLDQVGLFKTADRHYLKDTDPEPTSPQAARFFKFSENVTPNGAYYFQVVHEGNDAYGIRVPGIYKDDIKVIVVKKDGIVYKPVGVDGIYLDAPHKDNLVYTSIHGNEQLLDKSPTEALTWVKENFATKSMTDEDIINKINEFKTFRQVIKDKIAHGQPVYLTITDKSIGIQSREPLDVNTKRPQELPLEGRLIAPDNSDWVHIKHPDGTPIHLEVSTTGSVLNKKVKAGRIALVKDDGSIFQVYNRQLNGAEKANIIGIIKMIAPLMGRRYLDKERLAEIDSLAKAGKISPDQAIHLSNPLTESEQDRFDKAINYLMGVVYWRQAKEGETVGKDQFRVAKGMLYRGEMAVAFNPEEIEKNKDALMEGLYHQVNNKKVGDTANVFYEMTVREEQVAEKKWDNYPHYLLDGSAGRVPPIYTNVKPFVSKTDVSSTQLRSVYLTYGFNAEFTAAPVENSKSDQNSGETRVFTDPLAIPKEQGAQIAFVRKKIDKTTDLNVIAQWDGTRFKVVKLIDQNGQDFSDRKDIIEKNEDYINATISSLETNINIPDAYDAELNSFKTVYHRIETYNGQPTQPGGSPGIASEATTGTSGSARKKDILDRVLSVADTPENYHIWSNTRDGQDRHLLGEQIQFAINQLLSVDPAKLTKEGIADYLKNIKAFQSKDILEKVTGILLNQQLEEASTDTSGNTYSQAQIDTLIQQAVTTGITDIIDENARLALTDDPKVKEDIEAFKAWMKERLPQVPVHKVLHLINGRNWGQFIKGAIQIFQNAEQGTGYHEAFEAVWNAYLTTEEQQDLAGEFRERVGAFTNPFSKATKSHTEASMYDVREMLAEEFKDYVAKDQPIVRPNSPVRNTIFRRLWNFIKRMLGLTVNDNQAFNSKINHLFNKIDTGDYADAIPITTSSEPSYRALEGNTVEFTQAVMEGVSAIFFSKLYASQNNIEALFSKGSNAKLFNELYEGTRGTLEQYFNAPINSIVKVLTEKGITHDKIAAEVLKYTNGSDYRQKKSVLDRFNGEVLTEFKKFIGQFGLQFKEVNNEEGVNDERGEDNINEIEDKEQTATNALGIRESIYVDPRNMTKSTVRLLIASLTADEYKPNSNQVQIKKNGLGLPTLEDYGRKINILLNELHGVVPVYEKGKRVEAIDLMFRKLDERFKNTDGRFKKGFEWIQKLKSRLKFELNGQKLSFEHLTEDEIRLLIAFESSFTNNKNLPFKILIGEGGYLTAVDPVVVTNAAKVKEHWQNSLKSTSRQLKSNEDLAKAPLTYIGADGKIMFNTRSESMVRLLSASTNQTKLDGLKKMGINFTQSDAELLNSPDITKAIAESFNGISYAFREGLISGFDDLFGKQVVNGPISSLLAIELDATAEDNILSHQNAAGKQQFSITLPSAVSNTINSLKGVDNISDFILSNPQYGSVSANGEILLNPYQANSQLLKTDGILFDKNGKKKRDIDYQFILGMSLLTDNEGDNTDDLKYPDKIVQEIYHLLNGTYYTVINSDKSSEFGLNMGHFISWQDIKKPIGDNLFITGAYKNAMVDEIKAALFEAHNPAGIQYYSDGVTSMGHFRDILNFIPKENKSNKYSLLQKDFISRVMMGKESPEDFVNRSQVEALLTDYLKNQVDTHKKYLVDLGIVNEEPVSAGITNYSTNAFSQEQLDKLGVGDARKMSEVEYTNLVKFMTINRQIGVFEQHKLLYGHPALYKDLAKRSNGINSQKELMTENRQILTWMDKHMGRLDGKIRGDQEASTIRFVSYKDPVVISLYHKDIAKGMYDSLIKELPKHTVEQLIGATFDDKGAVGTVEGGKGTYIDAYINANEPDGQAYVMMDFFRDMLFQSGKLSKEQSALWEYERAVEINDRSNPKSDYYKEYTKQDIDQARALLQGEKPNGVLQTLKPQGFGYQTTEGITHTTFLKHSVFPLTWTRVRDQPNMAKLYISSQGNKIDVIGFESGEKVGNVLQNGGFVQLYGEDGTFNSDQLPIQEMYSKYYGIQVEMAAKTKEKVVMGTQMRKLILSNLPEELRPVADQYFKVLEDLMALDKKSLLHEVGLTRLPDGSYQTDNLEGLVNTLRQEAISRELPDNVIDMLSAVKTEAGDRLAYKFDANPIREKIDNILNAIVDSRVISQKMFGKASVQVASTLWEKNPRSFMYLKEGIWTSTEGIEKGSLTAEEQKSVRMISSDLKFYTREEPWMEVLLPHYFEGMLPTDINLADIDPRLLAAIGFRIPTQGMNSIDNIRIKGFLDPSMGDVVVVPSEIVGKSGSDFDIDKLNIYLPNYTIETVNGKKSIKYVDPAGSTKEALQNRLIQLMGQILSHPDNYRQLIVPNGAETLKGLADEIRRLKGLDKEGAGLTRLSEWKTMVETRERYISGKKLVGIGALQITSHTVSQLAGIQLTGTYKARDGQELPIKIKFDHNSEAGKFYLTAVMDKGNQYISELLSEALTGFVDAAKDPFIFDLNLNLQTAATWFYLQKLGVPVKELAYLHTQPLIEQYFAEQGKNESYVNKANDTELVKEMVIFKVADPYFQKAFDTPKSLYQLGQPDSNGKWRTRKEYFKLKEELLSKVNRYRGAVEKYAETDLRNNIQTQNKAGYRLTKEDALKQLALLYDYLDYQQQAGYLSNFINAISYDTAKTKNIIENRIQDSTLQSAYNDNFVTRDSINRVFSTTFLGAVKDQKQDIANMFKDFFVSLHPNAQPAFEKVIDLINNPALNMTKDKKAEVLNRYQNFFITSLLHTVKFKAGTDERSLNEWYGMFFGDRSLPKQLKEFQDNPRYKNNLALKQLFPLINSDKNATDNIKLFNNRLSSYEINVISEALMNLKQQAEAENNAELGKFVGRLGVFSILQSGVQASPITYTKILPIEIYSKTVGDILDRFTGQDIDNLDPTLMWKQFFQNNWYNSQLVPRVKKFSHERNGLISISGNFRTANYDYVSTRELKPEYAGKVNEKREDLVKQKRWDDLYNYGLFERIPIKDENGSDLTDDQPVVYYRPINRLGNRMSMTETYGLNKESILPKNEPFDESQYEEAVEQIQNKTTDTNKPKDEQEDMPCEGGTPF